MSTPILSTKLYIPPPRPNFVQRARLIEALKDGQNSKLILVFAPSGFGKTSLVCAWIKENKRPVAWLLLDDGENNPVRFTTCIIAALQTIVEDFGKRIKTSCSLPSQGPTNRFRHPS